MDVAGITDVALRMQSNVSVTRTKGQTVGAVDDGFHGAKEHILTVDPKHAMLARVASSTRLS